MKQKMNNKGEEESLRELSNEELDCVTGGIAGPERSFGTKTVEFEKPVYDPGEGDMPPDD